jgi:sugar-specific transcriptional regulator TrmB
LHKRLFCDVLISSLMNRELKDIDFQRFWRRLQQIGLNAYEARAYMVLVGHPRFKALELAARANVPRQKIYEVLDSLAEKGFAQVVQEKTKLFSATEPGLAIPSYIARRQEQLQIELTEQGRVAGDLVEDLNTAYSEGQEGRGTLDYLRIVTEPGQTAVQYRRMISEAQTEYLEFSRPPYAVDPLEEKLVKESRQRGVDCRLLLEGARLDDEHRQRLGEYQAAGVAIRQIDSLPMKLALFDGKCGMIALLDPLVTKPAWTSVLFEHPGMCEAMKGLFETYWKRASEF